MVNITGHASFDARIRRALAKLDPGEYQNLREIRYGGNNPLARACGGEGVAQIFDLGLAEDDVGLASIIAHENYHAGHFSLDEVPAVAAELAVLRRHGRTARADQIEAWSKTQQFYDAGNAYYAGSGTAVHSASSQPTQPQVQPAQPQAQPDQPKPSGMEAWQLAYLENKKRRKFLAWFP